MEGTFRSLHGRMIQRAVNATDGRAFTTTDIAEATGLRGNVVSAMLANQFKRGNIVRHADPLGNIVWIDAARLNKQARHRRRMEQVRLIEP